MVRLLHSQHSNAKCFRDFSTLGLASIDRVEITMQSVYDPSVSTNTYVPRMMICNDFNSGATGTSTQAISEHADAKALMSTYNKWNVKPKYQRVIFYNAVTRHTNPPQGLSIQILQFLTMEPTLEFLIPVPLLEEIYSLALSFFLRAKNVK